MAEYESVPEFEQIGTSIDIYPDDDSFLPRYLTVQLLEILASTISPKTTDPAIVALTKNNEKFIAAFKNIEMFTALTYSVFWREDTLAILDQNRSIIDEIDKYNRAPLTLAIANEDFKLAVELLQRGATLMLEDKLVLEIALLSMIQRDPSVIEAIMNNNDYDPTWLQEYLEYLYSYVEGTPKTISLHYHEVLNPPLRHFGQILDTLAYFNGLPSHYGYLSPSIEVLSAHLQLFTEDLNDPSTKGLFSKISDAYSLTSDICKYYGNLPTEAGAAKILTGKIMANLKTNGKDIVVLFGGWAGSSVSLAFIGNTLIFSNLGIGGNPDAGTKIYNIQNADNINEQVIDIFIRGLGNATAPSEILAIIGSFVDPQPIYTLKQSLNPIDNCIFVNPRAIVQGILLVFNAYNRDGKVDANILQTLALPVTEMFNSYVNSLYKYSTADLAKFMRNHELLQNKRLECCALALDYINQHYKEPEALARCIELKDALEFVGLKDFYLNNIEPEAQAAIQQLIIHEQEATALKVIEQENYLAANPNAEAPPEN